MHAVYPEGSYGNGAAMRAPVLALFFRDAQADLLEAARVSARVTHAHPLGIEGSQLIALAAQALLQRADVPDVLHRLRSLSPAPEFRDRLERVEAWLSAGAAPSPREVAGTLGNGMTAPSSCPTALYVALRHLHDSFEELMRFIIACRGDVDTIGAMAGALWGIANGPDRLPDVRLEGRGEILALAERMRRRGEV